jgi:hypothetical protein
MRLLRKRVEVVDCLLEPELELRTALLSRALRSPRSRVTVLVFLLCSFSSLRADAGTVPPWLAFLFLSAILFATFDLSRSVVIVHYYTITLLSLGFAVGSMHTAGRTKLSEFKTLRVILLIFRGRIIALLTDGASQCCYNAILFTFTSHPFPPFNLKCIGVPRILNTSGTPTNSK